MIDRDEMGGRSFKVRTKKSSCGLLEIVASSFQNCGELAVLEKKRAEDVKCSSNFC